jgi:hypothetical protein
MTFSRTDPSCLPFSRTAMTASHDPFLPRFAARCSSSSVRLAGQWQTTTDAPVRRWIELSASCHNL